MLNADDILMPLTIEEYTARMQKKLEEAEIIFPRLLYRARKWVRSDDFKKMFKEVPKLTYGCFIKSRAPVNMITRIALDLTGMEPLWQWDDRADMVVWIADYLWKTEGMHKKYYVIRRLPRPNCSFYHETQ